MNQLRINGFDWQSPANYNELTPQQLLAVCKLLVLRHMAEASKPVALISDQMIRQRLVAILFGIKHPVLFLSKKKKAFIEMGGAAHATLMYEPAITNWVFEKANLTNHTIQSFKHNGKTYYGPAGGMLDISVGEFIEAIMYFSAYTEKPSEPLLNKLIAVLYRPGKLFYNVRKLSSSFNPDRRVSNNAYHFEKRAVVFNNLPANLKLALFLQFEGAFAQFSKSFKKCFSKKGKGSSNGNWISLLMSMSNDIFGDYEATQKVDCFTFFTKVEQNIIQMEKQKNVA